MKPIIIYLDEKDNFKLTKEKLEEIIDRAYQAGFNDGKQPPVYIPTVWPDPAPDPQRPYITWATEPQCKTTAISSEDLMEIHMGGNK